MARRAPLAGIPLAFRLPTLADDPIGRAAARAALAARLKADAVAVLSGPAGIGKSTVALAVTHAARKRRPETVRWLGPRAGALGPRLLRALAPRGAADADDWSRVEADPDGLWTTVLDLAEAMGAWVVLDGVDEGRAAIETLAPYVRRSRWLLTTRDAGGDDRWTQRVGPLPDAAMAQLAAQWAPDSAPGLRQAAIAAAAGVPGWLRRALTLDGPRLADAETRTRVIQAGALPTDDAPAMAALIMIASGETLPGEVLPSDAPLDRLIARGLIEPRPGGYAVHPSIRAALAAARVPRRAEIERALAVRLAELGRPAEAVNAVRLWLSHGQVAAAAALLDTHGARILATGGAPDLWQALARFDLAPVRVWRMRAAIAVSDPTARAAIGPPPEGDAASMVEWARLLTLRGDLSGATAVAERAAAHASGTPALRREATRVAARALMNQGLLDVALDRLGALPQPTAADQAQMLECRASLGESGALGAARVLFAGLDLSDPEHWQAGSSLSALFARAGQAAEALRAFDALAAQRPLAAKVLNQRVVRTLLGLAGGRWREAQAEVEALQPLVNHSMFGLTIAVAGAALRMVQGALSGLDAELRRLMDKARAEQRPDLLCFAAALAEELARIEGRPEPAIALDDPAIAPHARVVVAVRRWCGARRGRALDGEITGGPGELGVLATLARADAALATGAVAEAAGLALTVRDEADRGGIAVRGVYARELAADAALIAGQPHVAVSHIAEIATQAETGGSARFADEAAGLRALCGPADLGALERLAGAGGHAPVAARRARALLGDPDAPLDPVDGQVLAAVRARPDWPIVTGSTEGFGAGWGLDLDRRGAWLPDGRTVSFAHKDTQWALLAALADGVEHKEALCHRLWPDDEYHPLRHDNRLHATARLVRVALADNEQVRVLTTEHGYRLGGPLRRAQRSA